MRPDWAASCFRGTVLDPARAAAPDAPAAVRVHYHGWSPEHDEWLDVPPPAVLGALVASANAAHAPPAATSAMRAAITDARIAPALTHASALSTLCVACHNARTGALLFCDAVGCGRAYHLGCLKPLLDKPPAGKWFCPLAHRKGKAPARE